MQGVTILGATGSIGASTLDVLGRHPDRFRVVALTANTNVPVMLRLCRQWRPEFAVLRDPKAADELRRSLVDAGVATEVLSGTEGLTEVAALPRTDFVMAAIVGAAGLLPTLAAARAGKRVLLANKEALVMAGPLFMAAVREHGAELLPIDSEHNALFQCLPADHGRGLDAAGVRRLLLTASGGPFLDTPVSDLNAVTPDQACAHPKWAMGRKISVDSATLMNKGLEVIEARWLFAAESERIEVVVHPQSVIHSMVEYRDGSVLAQLGNPDMRTPIAHALAWPERIAAGVTPLDFPSLGALEFRAPDEQRFPCLRLAREALQAGGGAPALLNAANEEAVQAFLDGRLRFVDIPAVIESVLARLTPTEPATLNDVLALDAQARDEARIRLRRLEV
jgi:1-deoxy-D-xylulose-5-phosphate reductoisomerase